MPCLCTHASSDLRAGTRHNCKFVSLASLSHAGSPDSNHISCLLTCSLAYLSCVGLCAIYIHNLLQAVHTLCTQIIFHLFLELGSELTWQSTPQFRITAIEDGADPSRVFCTVSSYSLLGPIRATRSDKFTDSRSAMQHDLNQELLKPMLQKGLVVLPVPVMLSTLPWYITDYPVAPALTFALAQLRPLLVAWMGGRGQQYSTQDSMTSTSP